MAILAIHTGLMYWFDYSFRVSFIDAAVSTSHLMLASYLLINTLRYYVPKKEKFIYLLAWCTVLTILITLLSRWALFSFLRNDEAFLQFVKNTLVIRISFYFLLIGIVALLCLMWYGRLEEDERIRRKEDTEKLAREAELIKLRQQLQPHFLFNSLNSINALIGSRPEEARKMVQQLSDFLRGTLKKDEHHMSSLKEELEHLQLYLEIEKVRFGHRLLTKIVCEEGLDEMKIPALLLQPVMENAIKFGLYDTVDEIVIELHATRHENELHIKVMNPFDPETAAPKQGTGFGLQSVQRRLQLLYARNDLVSIDAKNNIFTTQLIIPQYEQSDNN
jgi:signal transduction histidine kinase